MKEQHDGVTAKVRRMAVAVGVLACALPLPAMANSPPTELWRIVLALFVTFPLNLIFLPGVLAVVSFMLRQVAVAMTVPTVVRQSAAHRERTRRWFWVLFAGLSFDALALVVLLLIFAAN